MAQQAKVAPHEILELHEMLTSDVAVARKLEATLPMVQDGDLRNLMEQALLRKKNAVDQLEEFYNNHTNQGNQ